MRVLYDDVTAELEGIKRVCQQGGAAVGVALGGVGGECGQVVEAVRKVSALAEASRKPLTSVGMKKVVKSKLFNPRFEEDFVAGRDYDVDKVRAEERKWKRKVSLNLER